MNATIAAFGQKDNCLTVGGIPIDRLAERAGSTPFFAYDRALLTARVGQLYNALPGDVYLKYAVKANPMPALVHHLSNLVDGLDVASSGEMHKALDTGIRPDDISFAGPGKTNAELRQAIAAGVIIELESENEAIRVANQALYLQLLPRVAIRVNPDFSVKGSGMRMGGGPQQFGVDSENVSDLVKKISRMRMDFVGFHIFAGSQNLKADILIEAQTNTFGLALRLADEAGVSLRYLNIGGGFGIPYTEKDEPLDLEPVGQNLENMMEVFRRLHPQAKVVMELGRYIVGECGVYVTRIVDRKESRGKVFLVVDGGMHHQLAASGNLGQVIRRNYPMVIGNRMTEEATETASIVGNLCTPLDLLGKDVQVPPSDVGDLVVLFMAGAYGLTASPTAFLGHSAPVELLV